MTIEKVTVIFRKDKSNKYSDNITAVFPYIIDTNRYDMGCYAHVGQHSYCSHAWYTQCTKPAKPNEYESLKRELESLGYDLEIKLKINSDKQRQAIKEYNTLYERI